MLSYQHAYHAGGPADVHKHALLALVLRHLADKPKPFCAIDLHAGEGVYDLTAAAAEKTAEYRRGIGLVWPVTPSPGLGDYLDAVRSVNAGGTLQFYPGSCAIMRAALRDQDRLIVNDLHPAAATALERWARRDPRIAVHRRDAIAALPALVPPLVRRGVVLIDPSYEVKAEYTTVAAALCRAQAKWSDGIFMLWYPLLADNRHRVLHEALAEIDAPMLTSEIVFGASGPADAPSLGLRGSGMLVINPPWGFAAATEAVSAWLSTTLAQGIGAAHDLTWLRPDK